jgi:hypothetical protein
MKTLTNLIVEEDVTISLGKCTTTQSGVSPKKYFCLLEEMWSSLQGIDGVSLGICAHPPGKMVVSPWGDVFVSPR